MEITFCDANGDPVSADELLIVKARDLALKIEAENIDFAKLVECRKNDQTETVVFDVDVEVPQICRHPIRPSERIAVTFQEADRICPIVHALRKDFPQVPHLNLDIQEFPRSLCLYDRRYEEINHRWTSARFVHWIREWLALTARGELHQEDQPLEPILIGHVGHIVLPHNLLYADDAAQQLFVKSIGPTDNRNLFLIAQLQPPQEGSSDIVASVHQCPPQTHGVIHRRPTTLADLAALVKTRGLDILAELRERLDRWQTENKAVLDSPILLVIRFPKKRKDDGEVKGVDTWTFFLGDAMRDTKRAGDLGIRDLGIRIGLWDMHDNQPGLLVPSDTSKRGDNICLGVLNTSFELTRSMAAWLNGNTAVDDVRIVAVGGGALGSQAVLNLVRSGFGTWTIIDHERLMPHNAARHGLDGRFIGWNKAEAIAFVANSIIGDTDLVSPLPVDVLSPGERSEDVSTAFRETDVILDMSTSIAVARKLACDVESDARRISLFLTPSGHDLVLIAEDKNRTLSLDALEMQYYRAVANDEELAGHFIPSEQRSRYGQSCRDITSTLPQHLVALHAAIGARSIREAVATPDATVAIWRADDNGNVWRVDMAPKGVIRQRTQSWTVVTDEGLLKKLRAFRKDKLPNETGGVLLGSFDLERMILYIVDALPSPPDSEEWPTLYIRGRKGLRHAVEALEEKTHGMLEYIGEWHSHPQGACTAASSDDLEVFSWLRELMRADGLPAVMIIVGDPGHTSCYVGEIMQEENLLPEASSHE